MNPEIPSLGTAQEFVISLEAAPGPAAKAGPSPLERTAALARPIGNNGRGQSFGAATGRAA